jgi:TATA-binding protein-associated factor
MKQMLDIIESDLFKKHMPSITYMRLDGNTDATKRHAVVQTFNSDPSIDCLLLTTHVGGLGLTLTGADTVIFVEHDWNPMKDLQAMDRAHRLGQKKVVNVYRLITKGTLEEKIMGFVIARSEGLFFSSFFKVCNVSSLISRIRLLRNKIPA